MEESKDDNVINTMQKESFIFNKLVGSNELFELKELLKTKNYPVIEYIRLMQKHDPSNNSMLHYAAFNRATNILNFGLGMS